MPTEEAVEDNSTLQQSQNENKIIIPPEENSERDETDQAPNLEPLGQKTETNVIPEVLVQKTEVLEVLEEMTESSTEILEEKTENSTALIEVPDEKISSSNVILEVPDEKMESSNVVLEVPDEKMESLNVVLEVPEGKIESSNVVIEVRDEKTESSATIPVLEEKTESSKALPEVLDQKTESSNGMKCSISIQFQDDVIADMYKSKFLKFLSSCSELQVTHKTGLHIEVQRIDSKIEVDGNSTSLGDEDIMTPNKRAKKYSKVKKELFMLDVTPSPNSCKSDLRYTTKFVVNAKEPSDDEECMPQNSRYSCCFNCGSDSHSLRECKAPRDYAKINLAKQRIMKKCRYHTEEQKNNFQPGKISKALRQALGLHDDEVPHHVYLMRQLGYPPGWLEEAKFSQSDLDIFDIDGKLEVKTSTKKRGLDEDKVIEYPGFNAPFHSGMKDDFRIHRVPPYSEHCSKKQMVDYFQKSLKSLEDDLEPCDMDIDCPEPKQHKEIKLSMDRDSPSLVDLEQQKQQLLQELNEEPKNEIIQSNFEYESEKGFLSVKTSAFGTPLLKSNSPYNRLPNPDNFSKDVSPVINFENLPNSTGKYEQLTDVLQKVRTTLKKVQNGNS